MSHRSRPVRSLLAPAAAALLACGLVLAAAAPADARTGRAAGSTAAADVDARTVVGTGVARVRGVPDVLTMRMGVTSRGRTVGEALDRNNAAAAAVIAALTEGGVDEKDVQTSSFSVGPVRDDRSGDITGYQVGNLLTVQIRNLAKAGSLIDAAATAGSDDAEMHGVSFGFDDTSDLIAQARTEAVQRARRQAEQLARAAGVELGEVRRISESSHDPGAVLAPERSQASDAGVPVEPGSEELSVTVSIVFAIA